MGADQKRKEARKRKFGEQAAPATSESNSDVAALIANEEKAPKKKKQKESPKTVEKQAEPIIVDCEDADQCAVATQPLGDTTQETAEKKAQRFIVFIGNLPFTATDDSIAKHFAKVHPKSIRHRTDKEEGKSKGFAFLEFEAYDRMKTCLKMYHHSNFDDGVSPARRLNVELTVGGGGGKSKDRKAKLKEKNAKLSEERQRRAVEEEKQAKKGGRKGPKRVDVNAGGDEGAIAAGPINHDRDVHPSRRSRMAQG